MSKCCKANLFNFLTMTPSYLSNFLHSGPPQTADFEEMKLNLEQLKEVNAQLTKENEELRQRVS